MEPVIDMETVLEEYEAVEGFQCPARRNLSPP